jgi:hypothetical protein
VDGIFVGPYDLALSLGQESVLEGAGGGGDHFGSRPNERATVILDAREWPKMGEAVMAEVHLSPQDKIWDEVFQPSKGDVRGFLFDPASGKTQFDMTDGRNSWTAQNAKMTALKERMLEDEPAEDDDSVTGPPWVVPAHCPTCGAAVNKATASMDLEPQCGYCHQPLPAWPRAR